MKITPQKYACALASALESSSSAAETVRNFLLLLRKKKQFKLLPKIVVAFNKEWRKRTGVMEAEVEYPTKFESVLRELEVTLEKSLGRKVLINPRPSDKILGGFKMKTCEILIDASIESRLNYLASNFNS